MNETIMRAAVGALFAFYEIFLSRKTVPYFQTHITVCESSSVANALLNFSKFLESNRNEFAYVDIKLSNIGGLGGGDCAQKDAFNKSNHNISDKDEYVPDELRLTLYPSHIHEVRANRTAWKDLIVNFDVRKLQNSVLVHFSDEVLQDAAIHISGIFYLQTEDEAGANFDMIPAPFDPITHRQLVCTKAANQNS